MFQNLRKLFIYLLLLPRTFTFPIIGNHGSEKTTPDVDEAVVEKELLRYAKYLDEITNTGKRGEFRGELKALVRQAIRQAKKAEKKDQEIGKLESDLNHERKKCDQILIPLSIRHFAFVIEDECSAVTFDVPPNIKATKDFSQNDIQRMYKFFNIFQQYKQQNMYVKCVSVALEESFKRERNIEEISGNYVHEYDQFMLEFCRSVVLAINFANKLVAHSENSGVARESLSIFVIPVDKFMTIFYNALMGHPAKK